jgi:hypothetical protein
MIDANRCQKLIDGEDPETVAEEMFILCFHGANENEDLQDLVIKIENEFNEAGQHELEMLILGYAMGQKQRKIDLSIESNEFH